MSRHNIFIYLVVAALLGAYALAIWLASQSRFLEAVSAAGVATTLAWFATRAVMKDDDE